MRLMFVDKCYALAFLFVIFIVFNYFVIADIGIFLISYFLLIAFLVWVISQCFGSFYGLIFLFNSVLLLLFLEAGFFSEAIDGVDSKKYYNQAFGALYSEHSIMDMVSMGYAPIVQSYAYLLRFISWLVSADSVYQVVAFNSIFNFLSAVLFSSVTSKYLGLSERERFYLFVLVFLSPVITNEYWVLNKDIFTYFMVCLSSALLSRFLLGKSWVILTFAVFAVIFSMMLRPYSVIFMLIYMYVWGVVTVKWVYLSLFLMFVIGLYIGGFYYFRDLILNFIAIFAAPNFLRIENWENDYFMVVESLFFMIFVFPLMTIFIKKRLVRRCALGIVLFAATLAVVTVHRYFFSDSFVMTGLLADDVVRKKIQIIPVVYLVFLFCIKKISSPSGFRRCGQEPHLNY